MKRFYRRKIFLLLLVLLLLFAALFIISITNSVDLIDIGLPNRVENLTIAVLSFLSMLLVVWDMYKL